MNSAPLAFLAVPLPPPTVFVWQPGGAAGQAPNVFTTWAALYAAIQAAGESFYTVTVDTTHGPAQVPAGSWNLGAGLWVGLAIASIVQFQTGAQVTATNLVLEAVVFENVSTTSSPFTLSEGIVSFALLSEASLVSSAGAAPLLVANLGVNLVITTLASSIAGYSGSPVVQPNGGMLLVRALSQSTIVAGALAPGTGGGSLTYTSDCAIPAGGPPAGWTFTAVSSAAQTPYAPAVLANWSGTAPTSVANALDRIAAKITPIP